MDFADASLLRAQQDVPRPLTPREIVTAIESGHLPSDRAFDAHLPDDLALVSPDFWTPLEVAVKAGSWFSETGATTVLDIGSGPGKFCIAASLVSECVYFGVEHRRKLVAVAEDLARRFGVEERVTFIEGVFGDTITVRADAVYLYNPFGENLRRDGRLDDEVLLGPARFRRDVMLVERFLKALPTGTLLITYNGFGGIVPESFAAIRADEQSFQGALRMWRKE